MTLHALTFFGRGPEAALVSRSDTNIAEYGRIGLVTRE